jgi:succinyl-diaminopimelate desuccinylase
MAISYDPASLTQALIRRPSVTPQDHGAIDVVAEAVTALGFRCTPLTFQSEGKPAIRNLWAKTGEGSPHFCFAGHTDVVPTGPLERWSSGPFEAGLRNGEIVGRGAVDMKGAIAAFISAAASFLKGGLTRGSISLLITGDEEGEAVDGTKRVLEWMRQHGEKPDFCVVGEPSSNAVLGDMVKIGRRGSLNGRLTVTGVEGHVAYPHLADNPIPALISILSRITARRFDDSSAQFDATNLEVVSVDVGNPATNVIPREARANFNIRFNTAHSGASLSEWLRGEVATAMQGRKSSAHLDFSVSGEPFLTQAGAFSDLMVRAVREVTGQTPVLSTTGGTSDARFIAKMCPVAEFGLVNQTMHKTDERVAVADLERLTAVYRRMLELAFEGSQAGGAA